MQIWKRGRMSHTLVPFSWLQNLSSGALSLVSATKPSQSARQVLSLRRYIKPLSPPEKNATPAVSWLPRKPPPRHNSSASPLTPAFCFFTLYPYPVFTIPPTMPGLVSDATRIWELNIQWALNAQCGVWDPRGKGVDIWECIRAREFTATKTIIETILMLFSFYRLLYTGHRGMYTLSSVLASFAHLPFLASQ